ncbi:hypothetical protein B0T24DRAFT_661779 [Lasiosphaeria ovina]|uniref:Uncharacterized protein n=1 Tax=Lasiosphaeria ovina TaxID=92902 RepID=A0AAE0NKM1_9PEZI|nr:hypothetical protein B0T24DRAFT_661779 [Lasiosphaeria ovina]
MRLTAKHVLALLVILIVLRSPPPPPQTTLRPLPAVRARASRNIMSRKKNSRTNTEKQRRNEVVKRFDDYFGAGKLEDWQRLCIKIGLDADGCDLASITKCRKALKSVYINIYDLVEAIENGTVVPRFASLGQLVQYTLETGSIYPKARAKKHGPVRALLRIVFHGK